MGAGASKPSAEEVAQRYKKCAAVASAYRGCVRAEAGGGASGGASGGACASLETQLLCCIAAQVSPDLVATHKKCVNKAMSMRGYGPTACGAEVEAMAKAAAKAGLWPPPP